jgi:LysM repeat protein
MRLNRAIVSIVLLSFIMLVAFLLYQKQVHEPLVLLNRPITLDGQIFPRTVLPRPRDKVVEYIVQDGDTISSIGEMFDISVNTIRWANRLTSNTLTVGQTLKILPVTGVSHIVVKGDTIESLAVKYHTTSQKIIDFPYNEYANIQTHSLIPGKTLIIPDGRM